MKLTDKDISILKSLAYDKAYNLGARTCRSLSERGGKKHYAQWAMPSLRRLELRGFVCKAEPNRYNDITWKITDAGLERLALTKGQPAYRHLFDQKAGSPPDAGTV
jgi:hypothetical protein